MKPLTMLLSAGILLSCQFSNAQEITRKCGMEEMEKFLAQNPATATIQQQIRAAQIENTNRYEQDKVSAALKTTVAAPIPIVFHIVLNQTQLDKIGGATGVKQRVDSQIAVLNRDFNAENSDTANIPAAFKSLYGSTGIRFGLARRTPDGSPSDGYEIVVTTEDGFEMGNGASGYTTAKHTSSNGANAWDPTKYLNVWVINPLENGSPASILGLCIPPSFLNYGISNTELGLVLNYGAFGKRSRIGEYYISGIWGGRTLTHEIGHYFELRHIWGDDNGACPSSGGSDDGIADTPPQSEATYGCPVFPKYDNCSANGSSDGIMFMNYMDYVNDNCMYMFTKNQISRMQSNIQAGTTSYSLTQNSDLLYPTGIANVSLALSLVMYPNPTTGVVYLSSTDAAIKDVRVYNVVGNVVFNANVSDKQYSIDLSAYPKGVYSVQCSTAEGVVTKKVVLQ